MRKIYLFFAVFLWMLVSCERDNIGVYHAGSYIQFSKNMMDSSACSFLFYSQATTQLRFPVVVEVIGIPSRQDREYKVEVVADYTTAPAVNYTLPTSFSIKAGAVVDTCWIVFNKTDELAQEAKRLTVRLVETNDFELGQTDCLANIVYVSNTISRPAWWDIMTESYFLGTYSDKKYRLFIEQTGQLELNMTSVSDIRYYLTMFGDYLRREKEADRTVYEDDGSTEMTIPYV